jgi:hypothetical protein
MATVKIFAATIFAAAKAAEPGSDVAGDAPYTEQHRNYCSSLLPRHVSKVVLCATASSCWATV